MKPSIRSAAILASALFGALSPLALHAQQSAAAAQAAPPKPTAEQIAAYVKADEERKRNDWPWLTRFKEDDAKLGAPAPGEKRVVFMGDSITQGWHLDAADEGFPGLPYVNRGISGQTSPQMLLRFRQDVIDLQPAVVVILAGTNDVAENTGPMTPEQTEGNIASMAELATAHHIKVVLCSILPALDFSWHRGMMPAPKIAALNDWIKGYAAQNGYVYVDYYSAMKDDLGGLPASLSHDGVHPLPAGYAVMKPLVAAGIAKALAE